jgi:ABC-type multidrug transport system ATPase subunit
MKVLIGELLSSGGSAHLAGVDVLDPAARRLIGYCPQFDALIPAMSAREHFYLFGRFMGIGEDDLRQRVLHLIRETGLIAIADRPVGTYSGGNKRWLSLALR